MKRLSVEEESFQILFFSDSDTVTTALIYMECTAADGGSIVAYVPLWMGHGDDLLEFGETLSGFHGKGKTKLWNQLPWKLDATCSYQKTTQHIHY